MDILTAHFADAHHVRDFDRENHVCKVFSKLNEFIKLFLTVVRGLENLG